MTDKKMMKNQKLINKNKNHQKRKKKCKLVKSEKKIYKYSIVKKHL